MILQYVQVQHTLSSVLGIMSTHDGDTAVYSSELFHKFLNVVELDVIFPPHTMVSGYHRIRF